MLQPDRPGVGDQRPEQSLALRQVADLAHGRVVHADVDELFESAVGADDAQRAVPSAGDHAAGFDDVAQHRFQGEIAGDGLDRPQQRAQSALRAPHAFGAVDQLVDELVQLELRYIRKVQLRTLFGGHTAQDMPPCAGYSGSGLFGENVDDGAALRRGSQRRPADPQQHVRVARHAELAAQLGPRGRHLGDLSQRAGDEPVPGDLEQDPLERLAGAQPVARFVTRRCRSGRGIGCATTPFASGSQPIPRVSKSRIGTSSSAPPSTCGTASACTPSRRRGSSLVQARSSAR